MTGFWYVIKEGPFDLQEIPQKYRRHIKKSLERCEVRQINPAEFANQIWEVTDAAYQKYESADNRPDEVAFKKGLSHSELQWWAAFSRETGQMAGWMCCKNHEDYTETQSAKYHPDRQNVYPNDAIHYAILTHYLNELHRRYVCSCSRNINHKTHVQDYKIKNWLFRRAYCHLHIVYHPRIAWLIKLLYPMRKVLMLLDGNVKEHQLNSLLRLEEIARQSGQR